jgi:hypothetical protein
MSMLIEYDPSFVEQTVFLFARNNPDIERNLHATIDDLYNLPTGQERDKQFQDAYSEFFIRLRLDRIVAGLTGEWPLIAEHVGRCLVREAQGRKAESAELHVQHVRSETTATDRTIMVQICPHSMLEPTPLSSWMRRELAHIDDMIDPGFKYSPQAISEPPSRQNLILDRFRVLWDIYVEGRLLRKGMAPSLLASHLRSMLERVFPGHDSILLDRAFKRVLGAATLTHAQLLQWARSPETLFGSCRGDIRVPLVDNQPQIVEPGRNVDDRSITADSTELKESGGPII